MDKDRMLREIAVRSGYSEEETRQFYAALVDVFTEALGNRESIDCLPEWGSFIPKLRDNMGRQENSPRAEKKPHYYIRFRPSKVFERKLLLDIKTDETGGWEQTCRPPVWEVISDEP